MNLTMLISSWSFLGASSGEIVVAIVTSLIASLVFWFAFDRVPRWYAQRKVQPLIDYDLYQVYMGLFFFLETPFRPSIHTASLFQEELFTGKITQEDFRSFLSTKCLSEEYRSIDSKAKELEPIGKKLQNRADEIAKTINQLFIFNQYLSADQILLCRKVLDEITTYSYDMPAFIKHEDGVILCPVNPTANSLSRMFANLYALFGKLQDYLIRSKGKSVFKNYRRELDYRKASILFSQKNYKRVIKLTKDKKDSLLSSIFLRALYQQKGASATRTELISFLKQKDTGLISNRSTFAEMLGDKIIEDTLIAERSQAEYDAMLRCIKEEAAQKEQLRVHAQELEKYYSEKVGMRG